jgi:hypothetical protein
LIFLFKDQFISSKEGIIHGAVALKVDSAQTTCGLMTEPASAPEIIVWHEGRESPISILNFLPV